MEHTNRLMQRQAFLLSKSRLQLQQAVQQQIINRKHKVHSKFQGDINVTVFGSGSVFTLESISRGLR